MLSRIIYTWDDARRTYIHNKALWSRKHFNFTLLYRERDIVVTFQLIMLINLFVHKNIRAPLFFFLSLRLCEQIIIITAHSRASEQSICVWLSVPEPTISWLSRRMDGWDGRAVGCYAFISSSLWELLCLMRTEWDSPVAKFSSLTHLSCSRQHNRSGWKALSSILILHYFAKINISEKYFPW
jgi:hypothetical protein